MLGVSRASAGEMLKRLEAEGLVERGEHKEALLTPSGPRARGAGRPQAPDHRAAADRLHGLHGRRGARLRRRARRHVLRRHGRADRARSSATRSAARTAGRSIPTSSRPRTRSCRRSRPRAGPRATIVRLAEHDGELLHWFYDQGSCPAPRSSCSDAQPAAGQFTVQGGRRRAGDRREGRRRPVRAADRLGVRVDRASPRPGAEAEPSPRRARRLASIWRLHWSVGGSSSRQLPTHVTHP